ncbi:hypothetical protein SAMN04487948_101183 [Halogranum amylolyticum]|uniref:DUF7344 domain-containing protein n=1 Tax=Halogranum amylolyticum TaxID=660520 RepID=A0A1H8MY79_9EURY|nr:hypothetical protein [Halogranum amylolyticum]SEO22345.1 hypothetical protein SAMN04487948_101183 [Halogranum amylolyticum]
MSAQNSATGISEEPTSEQEPAATDLAADEVFHLLQNARRRAVLRYLFTHDDEPFEMRDIAEFVAAWENDTTLQQLTSDERQRAYISLYQCHLPKLDDKGIVDYNQSRGVVTPTAAVEQFRPYIDIEGESEGDADDETETEPTAAAPLSEESNRYYGTATVVSLLLTAVSWLGVAPAVLSSYLSFLITGLFALVTVGVLRQRRFTAR